MNRIHRIFISNERRSKSLDSKARQRKPRLERRNALRNINYEPGDSSPSASGSEESTGLRTRSLDLSPLGDKTSFRVEGNEEEFELIFKSLGLSGPEDFAIPAAAWEAMKVHSLLDVLPISHGLQFASPKIEPPPQPPGDRVVTQLENRGHDNCRVVELNTVHNRLNVCGGAVSCDEEVISELSNRLGDAVRLSGLRLKPDEFVEPLGCGIEVAVSADAVGGCGRGNGGGIKGIRPPILAPPPLISLPAIDNECSTWDILRSFAPDSDRSSISLLCGGFSSDDEEEMVDDERVQREDITRVRLGGSGVLSESCSFTTTSYEDDSSSTATERSTNISPVGRFKRNITYWEKGGLLGRGSFGSVYEGIAEDGFFFAVKEVSLLDQGEQGKQSIYQLEQEIALLSQFEHENIVQYYGTDKDESNLYIFLELITQGSLLSLYRKYNLRDSHVSAYTRQILHGLKYLHDRNVVHRDIKCANILVDASGLVKLADFGLAKATKLNDVKSCKGTAFWMAPEVINQRSQGYGLAADIWSLGCSVLEMLTRQIPYSPLEYMQALYRIGRGKPPPVPDSLSRDARDFILTCLQVNPNARPSAAQLLEHPFVKAALYPPSAAASPLHPVRPF